MVEVAGITKSDPILEIGTGSGYAAAVLAELAAEVFTIERHRELAGEAENRLYAAGYRNISVKLGDGTRGWPRRRPSTPLLLPQAVPPSPSRCRSSLRSVDAW